MTPSPQITSKVPGIIWEPITHNFGQRSRGLLSIAGIGLHETAAHGDPRGWFDNPASEASSNYFIPAVGGIKQFVAEIYKAWAQGLPPAMYDPKYAGPHKIAWPYIHRQANGWLIDPNDYLVSIECEKLDADPWTDPALDSLTSLMADIGYRFGFLMDRAHVVGHHDIWDDHICPGEKCPFDAILAAAAAKLSALKGTK